MASAFVAWFVIIIIAVVVVRTLIRASQKKRFPKVIWTYWEGDVVPNVVQHCIRTWKASNPDFKIVVLRDNNLKQYIDMDINTLRYANTPQRRADFIRLLVLAKHGGFWCDASIILNGSLTSLSNAGCAEGSEYIGYYMQDFTTDERYPVIENWFMACVPGNRFVKHWRDEFLKINEFEEVRDYVEYVESDTDLQNIPSREYLTMHIAAQKVIQRMPEATLEMYLMRAGEGPFLYLVENDWDTNRAVNSLVGNSRYGKQLMIKLRGTERDFIQKEGIKL